MTKHRLGFTKPVDDAELDNLSNFDDRTLSSLCGKPDFDREERELIQSLERWQDRCYKLYGWERN